MTLEIDLQPEVAARVQREAEQRGLSLDAYIQLLIEGQHSVQPDESLWERLSADEWKREFHAWINSHDYLNAPVIPLEALRRENLYDDRV